MSGKGCIPHCRDAPGLFSKVAGGGLGRPLFSTRGRQVLSAYVVRRQRHGTNRTADHIKILRDIPIRKMNGLPAPDIAHVGLAHASQGRGYRIRASRIQQTGRIMLLEDHFL